MTVAAAGAPLSLPLRLLGAERSGDHTPSGRGSAEIAVDLTEGAAPAANLVTTRPTNVVEP
jgi:hypothetical protein